MLSEFMMIHHLLTEIPPEFTGEQVGAELLRRIQAVFNQYDDDMTDRVLEDGQIKFTTPYDHMIMPHMEKWNSLLINALKTPGKTEFNKFISYALK